MTYQGKEAGRSIKVLVGIRISTEVIVVQMFCSRGAERTNIQFHDIVCGAGRHMFDEVAVNT